ncbi:MAG TPA: hypothetical protein VGD59_05805 [Acidisarcina sp.]
MSRLKIEKGASKVRRAPLKATIDGTVADDLGLMCEWSENDTSYLVNLLLGFAIAQSEDFQSYKAGRSIASMNLINPAKPVAEGTAKVTPSVAGVPPVAEKGAAS